jgi:esterase/lipase superfamily enzyme
VPELVVFVHGYNVNFDLHEDRSTGVSMLLKLLLACSSDSFGS